MSLTSAQSPTRWRRLLASLPWLAVAVLILATAAVFVALPQWLLDHVETPPFIPLFLLTFAAGSFALVADQLLQRLAAWRDEFAGDGSEG